jgi:uncharacterized RDD family membrane protein YckC
MNPQTPDPNALTQPIPRVKPNFAGSGAPAAYDHRFGNVPAYLLARLFACAVDVFVIAFVLATLAFKGAGFAWFPRLSQDALGFTWLAAGSLAAALFVTFLCEGVFGTTLGKLVFLLHVRRGNGMRAGLGRAFVRNLLRPVDLAAIGPLLALITPRHQRLGDLVGGTVVGRSPLGGFAPIAGLIGLAAIGYAQLTYGGGLMSVAGVSAEAAAYGPQLVARVGAPLYDLWSNARGAPAGASGEATENP